MPPPVSDARASLWTAPFVSIAEAVSLASGKRCRMNLGVSFVCLIYAQDCRRPPTEVVNLSSPQTAPIMDRPLAAGSKGLENQARRQLCRTARGSRTFGWSPSHCNLPACSASKQ
jgi:hypothetical protein